MILLPLPDKDSLVILNEVIAERAAGSNAAYFNGLAEEWRARLVAYIDGKGSPEHVPTWPQIQPNKGRFLNLYGTAKKDSSQYPVLKRMRDDHGLNYCPACGEPGSPNTLDHYLPKGKYPHFCVTPLNLFPMCDACQDWKDEKTGNAASPRFFIHPYYDVFVAEQVLNLTISPPFDAPTFKIGPREGLLPAQEGLVASHIRELGLPERFASFFKNEYLRLLRQVDFLRRKDLGVQDYLQTFQARFANGERNVWDHVLYSSVLSNDELLDYLTNGELKDYR
ncbi:hypothetical protein [Xanthomonas pisi]|nr:hypothetical protein [Xanthomonas pisi]